MSRRKNKCPILGRTTSDKMVPTNVELKIRLKVPGTDSCQGANKFSEKRCPELKAAEGNKFSEKRTNELMCKITQTTSSKIVGL